LILLGLRSEALGFFHSFYPEPLLRRSAWNLLDLSTLHNPRCQRIWADFGLFHRVFGLGEVECYLFLFP